MRIPTPSSSVSDVRRFAPVTRHLHRRLLTRVWSELGVITEGVITDAVQQSALRVSHLSLFNHACNLLHKDTELPYNLREPKQSETNNDFQSEVAVRVSHLSLFNHACNLQ